MTARLLLLGMIFICSQFNVQAQGFADTMKQIFGKQYPHYQWLDYPVADYGVGTSYGDKKAKADPTKFLCATFTCLEISPLPQDKDTRYTAGGIITAANCPLATVARMPGSTMQT